jgi:hypothetical protein
MKNTITYIGGFVMVAICIDMFLVLAVIAAIASGSEVSHIPFWDNQVRAFMALLPV